MNKIVVELHPEDRARLDRIIAALEAKGTGLVASGVIRHPIDVSTAHLEPVDAPAPAPAAEPAPVEPAPVEPVSLPEFQKAVTLRCAESAAMKKKVVALVHEFGPCVSEIPAEKRADFLAALAAL